MKAPISDFAGGRRSVATTTLDEAGEPPNWVQRIETLERRADVAEFMAIAKAVNADAIELFRKAMR